MTIKTEFPDSLRSSATRIPILSVDNMIITQMSMISLCRRIQILKWIRRLLHRLYWRYVKDGIWEVSLVVLLTRLNYFLRLIRIRRAYSNRKITVVFPVSNIAKWKCQSLYDLMSRSDKYTPIIVLTPMDTELNKTSEEQFEIIERNKKFFDERGCKWVVAYDCNTRSYKPFSSFAADIVWYTQPWFINRVQDVFKTSYSALTCYVPYFVQNYGGLDMDCGLRFHRFLWRHFTLSEEWANEFMRYQGRKRSGVVKGLGHPMLDNFYLNGNSEIEKKYVIYAPHWSCNVCERFSTFLENGRKMLALAKEHSEVKWVFKPHPTLRTELLRGGHWTESEIESYYAEWGKIGYACYDANYETLFNESIAMITDCASFLVEYACTGGPIIHLISSNAKYQPHAISAKLFRSYYQAHDWNEFNIHFNEVVLKRNDYKRDERLLAVKSMRLSDNYAARNILDYLDSIFSRKSGRVIPFETSSDSFACLKEAVNA